MNDGPLGSRMKEKGHQWRVIDQHVVGVDGKPPSDVVRFLDKAKGKGFPQVFLVDSDGRTRLQADLPKDPAALLQLITKAGG